VIKTILKNQGIERLYPPQEEAVKAGALNGANLVLAIPTAAGKTLVAELAMTKQILEKGGKALYLVPLRALAAEKYEEFKKYEEAGIKVAISTGDYDSSDPWLANYDIIVVTNEKADSLLRHRAPWIEDITIVVADEIHLINDPSRGPTLEMVLARLSQVNPEAQIIALSATIRNAEEIAEWLNAKLIKSEWRPIPLKKGVYCRGTIIFDDGTIAELKKATKEPCEIITMDTLENGGQVLVFTNTRQNAMKMALKLAPVVSRYLNRREKVELREIAEEVLRRGEVTRISEQLATCIMNGTAFHHAGLIYDHRKIVEDAFRNFKIKVVCATPTLAAGVNLPARRVVIRHYYRYDFSFGHRPIPVLEFHQMAGRAGRPKYDKYGEAILIAKTPDERNFLLENYIKASPEMIWSKLAAEPALRSHILAIIATEFAKTDKGLLEFLSHTFYYYQYGGSSYINTVIRRVLSFLESNEMITEDGEYLNATKLGKRVSELYIDPLTAVYIRKGLESKSTSTPLGYLHLIAYTPDMPKLFLRRGDRRKLTEIVIARSNEFLIKPPDMYEEPDEYEYFLAALKGALALIDWINEEREDAIIEKYDVGSGDIYALASTARWLLYSAAELSSLLKLQSHVKKLKKLMLRVEYGCKEELLQIVQLKGVGRVRARMLYNAGYRTIEDLKRATPEELLRVPSIGVQIVKRIKEQLGEPISESEEKKLRSREKEQKRIIDYLNYNLNRR